MADENEKNPEDQSEELYTWISTISFSKPNKNLTRDFSDAVLMAEVLKAYYPRYVDLHNYVPASNLSTKKENWNMLNRKVFSKIDMKLTKDTINQLANAQPGAVENLLLELKSKILKDFEHQNPQNVSYNEKEKDSSEEGKINKDNAEATIGENLILLPANRSNTKTLKSVFVSVTKSFLYILQWFINCLCIWNYFPSIKFRLLKNSLSAEEKKDAKASRIRSTSEYISEEDAVPRHLCEQLKQELREKNGIICTLNHKVAYLESAMKLKDLRISNLTTQILQNAVESEQFGKIQTSNDTQAKSRPRSQNIREKVKVEE